MSSRAAAVLCLVVAVGSGMAKPLGPSDFNLNERLELQSNSPAKKVAMGFYRPDRLPRPLSRTDEVLDVLVKLEAAGERCAGIRISRTGLVLTASHCVEYSLDKAVRSAVLDLNLLEHAQPATAYPKVKTWFSIKDDRTYLVFAGKGFSRPKNAAPDIAAMAGNGELLDRMRRAATGDWAILAVDGNNPACVKARPAAVKEGEPLWAFGFPGETDRPHRAYSNGHGVYSTYGEAVRDAKSSESFARFDAQSRQVAIAMYQPIIDSGDQILSNMDSSTGFSGGPLINAEGKLVGVRTAGGSSKDTFRNNSTYGISVKKIFEDLRAAGIDPDSIFDCP